MINREKIKAIKPVYKLYNLYRFLVFKAKLGIADLRYNKEQNFLGVPIPPPKLRHRVHGSLDKESFIQVGKTLSQNIQDLCKIAGRDIYSFEQVLDFGCGSGRVIRNFYSSPPPHVIPTLWN